MCIVMSARSVPSLAGSARPSSSSPIVAYWYQFDFLVIALNDRLDLRKYTSPASNAGSPHGGGNPVVSFTRVRIDAPGSSKTGSTGGLTEAARISQPPLIGAVG